MGFKFRQGEAGGLTVHLNRCQQTLPPALTAYAVPAERVRALASGFKLHVARLVEPAELAAVVPSLAGGGV